MTQEESSNPIKNSLFEHINNTPEISDFISEKRFDLIIKDLLNNCKSVLLMGDEATSMLATGIMHYLLTVALIPSQRKIKYKGVDVDIVIPDIRTLEKDSKKALVLYIPTSADSKTIEDEILKLNDVQQETQNIWVISSVRNMLIKNRQFVMSGDDENLSKIIFEISKFISFSGTGKFRIMRIDV